ncbi:MAG: winged helix-turn-helix transcriptional regulator [Chloroflexi bacterium]|nr:MAG: winged helix-turn-helix transcriptional regulator [Chloroflexota bacterium]
MEMDAFAALGDPTRRQLVQWLAVRPATATELSARLPVTRQAVVKHLGILEDARILAKRRDGREVRYRIEAERLDAAAKWIAAVTARWEARLSRLKSHLEGS